MATNRKDQAAVVPRPKHEEKGYLVAKTRSRKLRDRVLQTLNLDVASQFGSAATPKPVKR
jgi:hypothetical protein